MHFVDFNVQEKGVIDANHRFVEFFGRNVLVPAANSRESMSGLDQHIVKDASGVT